jgi:hypothetical protein
MLERLWTAVRYIVRTTGLFFVVCVAIVLGCLAFFGAKPSPWMAVVSGWVVAAAVLSWPRLPDAWRSDPPTDRQIAYAEALGIAMPPGISKGRLSDLISSAKQQR